jgi:nucleoside-diphosphate-sugar epimerase
MVRTLNSVEKENQKDAIILVTGATGQIGSELTLELRNIFGKKNVIAAGHEKKPDHKLFNSGPFEYIDITKNKDLIRIVKKYSINTIYHLASILSAVGEKNPQLAWNVNMSGLLNILEVARKYGVYKIFWPSSIAVFGSKSHRVNTPQKLVTFPKTIYGITKIAGEILCTYYFTTYGLDIRSIRYPGIISSNTLPGGGVTDYAIEMCRESIINKKYSCFVEKNTTLPMMYMPDCIKAAVILMETNPSKLKHRISYNISAMSFSAGELASEIRKYIPKFRCIFKPDFRQKIAESWPISIDDSIARKEWGWKPDYDMVSTIKDMMEKMSKMKPKNMEA